eukprot:SAG11_NODE_10848_length_802_cov_0.886202_2_plen_66_part_00
MLRPWADGRNARNMVVAIAIRFERSSTGKIFTSQEKNITSESGSTYASTIGPGAGEREGGSDAAK